MKTRILMTALLALLMTEQSKASCGPPECCGFPHVCGRGPEVEEFWADERSCWQKAARSVDGTIHLNPAGYPYLVRNDQLEEMAEIHWSNYTCTVKYRSGYHR